MKRSKGMQLGALLAAMLLMGVLFLSPVSATQSESIKVVESTEMQTTAIIGNAEINLVSNQEHTNATVSLTTGNSTNKYKIKVNKVGKEYIAEIYDLNGNLLRTRSYVDNPLKSKKGELPVIINGLIVDAFIDIWPDKYTYSRYEEGTVNIHVNNYAFPDGLANYFLRIPNGIAYINVYDGIQPTAVYNLPTSNDAVLIPEYGNVYGPATVLYWQDVHTFGYEKYIKAKVKYNSNGGFNYYSYDHEQEMFSGLPAWDEDSFSVTVS